jgi:Protein of unknown function (DUF4232)
MMMSLMARIVTLTSAFLVSLLIVGASSGARSASTATCKMSQFGVVVGPYVSEATQQRTLALRLINHADSTCVVNGYPRLTLYDARGAIPFGIRHGCDQMISSRRPRQVAVRHNRSVFLVMNKGQCVEGMTPSTRGTTKIVIHTAGGSPAETASIRFRSKLPMPWRIPNYCGKGDTNSILTMSPFVPTVRAALNG